MFQFLLTLVLLFIAPNDVALDPVIDDDGRFQCEADSYWDDEPNYYHWEDCLYVVSGTYDDDVKMSNNDHQALMEAVWTGYMGEDEDAPRLRRGKSAVEDVCEPYDDGTYPAGCYTFEWVDCGPWRICKEVAAIAVESTSRRLLLHEVAHAVYDTVIWDPFWGFVSYGAYTGTGGHDIGFRCFLLDIYAWYDYDYNAATDTYTYHVAKEPYDLLRNICVANGWSD